MDDAGKSEWGRPKDTADAITNHFSQAIESVFKSRELAISEILKQKEQKDPPKNRPLWQELLVMVGQMALGAVTAGLSQRATDALSHLHVVTTERLRIPNLSPAGTLINLPTPVTEQRSVLPSGVDEFVKVLGENAMNGALSKAASDNANDMSLTLRSAFERTQLQTLEKARGAQTVGTTTNLSARAEYLDKQQPQAGLRYVMETVQVYRDLAASVYDEQRQHTLNAWCVTNAQHHLHKKGQSGPTDLYNIVDSNRLVDTHMVAMSGDPSSSDALGLESVPGVLAIELKKKTDGSGYEVSKSRLPGLNTELRSLMTRKSLIDLRIPIVVSYSTDKGADSGKGVWVFSRNERGQILTDTSRSNDLEVIGGGNAQHGAVLVLKSLGKLARTPDGE